MVQSFQPFPFVPGNLTGESRRIRNDDLMAQHPRLGNACLSVFHTRAILYASLLLTFVP
jgi:hypothetical protein